MATINLKNKSLADIQAMIKQLTAAETAVKEQETAKAEALAKYENEKFAWAEACCKLLKGVTPASFEAVFTELPAKPAKPAILSTTKKVVRTRTTTTTNNKSGVTKKEFFDGILYPVKRTDLENKVREVYPDSDPVKTVKNYCRNAAEEGYVIRIK